MRRLSPKQIRTVGYAVRQLYAKRSFGHANVSDGSFLARSLHLSDNRILLLSDAGLEQIDIVARTLAEADIFEGEAEYSDYWAACKQVVTESLSAETKPESGEEFAQLIIAIIQPQIKTYTFAVALHGVQPNPISDISLGKLRLVAPSISVFDNEALDYKVASVQTAMQIMGPHPWLIGEAKGLHHVAAERFTSLAVLTSAALAVYAGSRYHRGATSFRLVPVTRPTDGGLRSAWFFWEREARWVAITFDGSGKQRLAFDAVGAKDFADWPVRETVLDLVSRPPQTALEDAILRALYWFGDAHRDAVDVMQLVKYWSCVECFFSGKNEDIANSVSTGLAAILVYGDYQFVEETKYATLKQRLKKLYDLRSRAVHGAKYLHVDSIDVAELSQWVAWMLINMLSFSTRGFSTPRQVREAAERLDSALGGSAADGPM